MSVRQPCQFDCLSSVRSAAFSRFLGARVRYRRKETGLSRHYELQMARSRTGEHVRHSLTYRLQSHRFRVSEH